MKKVAFILALFAIFLASAQTKDTVRMQVNGSEIIILTDDVNTLSETDFNAIIKRLTAETERILAEHNQELAEISRLQNTNELTAEQADAQRQAARLKMEAQLEALAEELENWADRYGEQIDENANDPSTWKSQWESNANKYEAANPPGVPANPTDQDTMVLKRKATIVIDDESIRIDKDEDFWEFDLKDKIEARKHNKTTWYSDVYFGWNNWLNSNGLATNEGPSPNGFNSTAELNFWPSMTWGLGFGGKTRLGQGMLYLRYGTQFNWHFFQQKGNTVMIKSEAPVIGFDGIHFSEDNTRNYAKSTYRITYWDFPLLLEFDANKAGRNSAFSLAVGGYGGFRISSKRVLEYSDYNGDFTYEKLKNSFYTNGFRYGAMGQIGFGEFKITGKYDLTTLFRTNRNTPDYQIASVTIGWVFM